jgi:hypothetical protein
MTKQFIGLGLRLGRGLVDCGGSESTSSPSESLNILWNQEQQKQDPARTAQLEVNPTTASTV